MKIKFNWGHAVAIFFSLFVITLLTVVIYSTTVRPMLVEKDYYNKDIHYQQQINREKRTAALKDKLQTSFDHEGNIVTLKFPKIGDHGDIHGQVRFYKPSDASLDHSYTIEVDSTYSMSIDTQNLIKGYWRVKIFWSVLKEDFFNELKIEKQ